ncbi:hypothetical protein LCGC14_2051410 [marine sediment metagenome]|uniref:Uncharacterized protein n=1 Tax=marine sediment metagenome TaxID=412755 RepID=A0A0F9FBD6_9ZZZZ
MIDKIVQFTIALGMIIFCLAIIIPMIQAFFKIGEAEGRR